jgi:hypothetical protein
MTTQHKSFDRLNNHNPKLRNLLEEEILGHRSYLKNPSLHSQLKELNLIRYSQLREQKPIRYSQLKELNLIRYNPMKELNLIRYSLMKGQEPIHYSLMNVLNEPRRQNQGKKVRQNTHIAIVIVFELICVHNEAKNVLLNKDKNSNKLKNSHL